MFYKITMSFFFGFHFSYRVTHFFYKKMHFFPKKLKFQTACFFFEKSKFEKKFCNVGDHGNPLLLIAISVLLLKNCESLAL